MAQHKTWTQPPPMEIDPGGSYLAELTTSTGKIKISLLPQEAPNTVNNFIFLAGQNFYDGVIFHRVIDGFMIQTGDPTGTGRGGPGYKFADEAVQRKYTRGTVAMANAGPNTNGSQFFIVQGENVGLPPNYTIFGEVTDGIDVVDAIAKTPTEPGGEGSRPANPPQIEKIEVSQE